MKKVDVVLGLQWGDEGKGKVVDVLTPNYQVIARFQGGPNAGHSLHFEGKKYVLHTIPSGIFRDGSINIIGNGVVVDPVILAEEITQLEKDGVDVQSKLLISKKAHLILPTHRIIDAASEAASSFVESQSTLNVATKGLEASYQSITSDMDSVVKHTKNYGEKMESINSHLASINSVYELQLRNIQAQSESFGEQSEKVGLISNHLANICGEVGKIQSAVTVAADESEKYKAGAVKLSQQVAELNKVYGNMLNALG